MTTRRRSAAVVATVVLGVLVLLALIAAAVLALPVAMAITLAVFALVMGVRSRVPVGSGWWRSHRGRESEPGRWVQSGAPPGPDGPSWTTTWDTLPSSSAMPVLREQAAAVLTEWDVRGEPAQPSLLVLTELLTNAIEHAHPPLRTTIGLGPDYVRVQVHDSAAEPPRARWPGQDGRGHGLKIVQELALRHGWTPEPPGKTVWADVPLGWPE